MQNTVNPQMEAGPQTEAGPRIQAGVRTHCTNRSRALNRGWALIRSRGLGLHTRWPPTGNWIICPLCIYLDVASLSDETGNK